MKKDPFDPFSNISDKICDARDAGESVDTPYVFPEFVGPLFPASPLDIEVRRWHCPECGTKLVEVCGIGETCLGPMTCPVSDGILWWLRLSEPEREKAREARLRECRRYKSQGSPNFKDLDI